MGGGGGNGVGGGVGGVDPTIWKITSGYRFT